VRLVDDRLELAAPVGTSVETGTQATFCRESHRACATLLIVFSSVGVDGGDKAFEFAGLAERPDCSVMLLRDVAASWYHATPGIDGGVAGLAAFLAERTSAYERVVCLGYSMGGYAALLFGRLLAADAILAFAPQTVLACEVLDGWGDGRWARMLAPLQARGDPDCMDLARLFSMRDLALPDQAVTLFTTSLGEDLDALHAARLSSHAVIVPISDAPVLHSAIMVALRESGLLREIIDAALGGAAAPAPAPAPAVLERYNAWMAARRHRLAVDSATAEVTAEGRARFSGQVVVGPHSIDLEPGGRGAVRLGVRVWPRGRPGLPLREDRFHFAETRLEAGQAYPFHFDLELADLDPGPHELTVALVQEGRFWFDDLGFASVALDVEVAPFALTRIREGGGP